MIPTAKEVLAVAASQIGYCEKKTNAYLDDFTKNAGSNNYTRFGRDVSNPKYWNGNKQGQEWCTSFVCSMILYAAGGTPNGGVKNEKYFADVKAVQPYTSLGASCKYQTAAYKKAKRWSETPAVGDQAFFTRGHTGLVEKVGTKTVTLIEGNSHNKVERRTYSFPNAIFSGFGKPNYAAEKEEPKPSAPKEEPKPSAPKEEPKPGTETKPAAFSPYSAKVTPSNGLNVRTGAGTSYKKLGALKCGSVIRILEEKNGWGRIAYEGKTGWVCLTYVRRV